MTAKPINDLVFSIKKGMQTLPTSHDRRLVIYKWMLTISAAIVGMLLPTAQMWIVNGALALPDFTLLAMGLGLVIANSILQFLGSGFSNYTHRYLYWHMADSLLSELIDKARKVKHKYFNQKDIYDKLVKVSANIPIKVPDLLLWKVVPTIVGGIIGLVVVSLVLLYIHWSVAALVLLGNLTALYFLYRRMKDQYWLFVNQVPQKRWADGYYNTMTDKKSLKEMHIFGLGGWLLAKWKSYASKTAKEQYKLARKYSLLEIFGKTISIFFKIAALIITAYLIKTRGASIGSFVLIFGSITSFEFQLYNMTSAINSILENSLIMKDWREFLDLEEEELTDQQPLEEINIEVKDIKFSYPNSDFKALNGVSLKIKQGEKIAIVGENGSGKSTFITLLNGLYTDFDGEININGEPIKTQICALRKSISSLYQDFGMYELTLKDNLIIGALHREITDADLKEAILRADACDLLEKYSLETEVGSFLGKGINFSGGQWQKIALARTYLNKDAKMLILDEPTAALDAKAESAVYKRFIENAGGETIILISHRLGATKFADRIIVFEKGKIIEEGAHDELMARNGAYKKMYVSQAGMYV